MEQVLLFFGRVNEFGQVPVGEYAKVHSGTTFLVCAAVGMVLYLLFQAGK